MYFPRIRSKVHFDWLPKCYLLNASPCARCDTRSTFTRNVAGLNSEFFFPYTGCRIKIEEPRLPNYLSIIGEGEEKRWIYVFLKGICAIEKKASSSQGTLRLHDRSSRYSECFEAIRKTSYPLHTGNSCFFFLLFTWNPYIFLKSLPDYLLLYGKQ